MNKQLFIVIGCVLAIVVAGISIYFTQFRKPAVNETLHLGVGRAMARETANLLSKGGNVVALVMDSSKTPELQVQLDEFERNLQRVGGFKVTKKLLDTEGKAKYTTGAGLSGRRFVRAVKN